MSENNQTAFGIFAQGFMKGLYGQEAVRTMPINYASRLIDTYDFIRKIQPTLSPQEQGEAESHLEAIIEEMKTTGLFIATFEQQLKKNRAKTITQELLEKITEYQSSVATRESSS